jgi:thiol-disulfide isomerase/thioredoxin
MIPEKSNRVVFLACVLSIACSACCVQPAAGQSADKPTSANAKPPNTLPTFPTDPSMWLNSGPVTVEALQGKGVFVWFYEETCPKCRAKWPELLATAKQFEGQPVIFMAVNSGTSRAEVQQYARELDINWPILVDSDRQFEKQGGVKPISLQGIWQACIITSDGRWQTGDWTDIEGTIKKALNGAAWKVDPAKVPASLRSAWLAIEFGNYSGAGTNVKKGLVSPKADVKAAAEKLAAVAQKEIDGRAAAAKTALDEGKTWQAYEIYNSLSTRFAGFDLPAEVGSNRKKLAADPQVKAGLVASKSLESARKQLGSGNAASQNRAKLSLEKIVQDFPGTGLADQASMLLQQATGSE